MPPSIHVFPALETSLPFRSDSLDALFLVETETMPLNRAALCEEMHRILRVGGLFFVRDGGWTSDLQRQGFECAPTDPSYRMKPANSRTAYISSKNGRLQVIELEKPHAALVWPPLFETAVCAVKR